MLYRNAWKILCRMQLDRTLQVHSNIGELTNSALFHSERMNRERLGCLMHEDPR